MEVERDGLTIEQIGDIWKGMFSQAVYDVLGGKHGRGAPWQVRARYDTLAAQDANNFLQLTHTEGSGMQRSDSSPPMAHARVNHLPGAHLREQGQYAGMISVLVYPTTDDFVKQLQHDLDETVHSLCSTYDARIATVLMSAPTGNSFPFQQTQGVLVPAQRTPEDAKRLDTLLAEAQGDLQVSHVLAAIMPPKAPYAFFESPARPVLPVRRQ